MRMSEVRHVMGDESTTALGIGMCIGMRDWALRHLRGVFGLHSWFLFYSGTPLVAQSF